MRESRQIELLERLVGVDVSEPFTYGAASLRNPASAYTCPKRFAEEQRVLFRERPQFVGLTAECANPGSYMTVTVGGVPIVVMRQQDDTLRALVNVCRHRGATLLEGRGAGGKRLIVCPYHGWTYDSDGKLVTRPAAGHGFDDVTVNCDLHTRAVAEKHGLIFVHPTSSLAFEVDPLLCGLQDDLADYGLGSFVHIETRVNQWRMNWKLLLDTFTESYHIRWLHKDSIAPLFLNDTLFDAFGPHGRAIGLRKTVTEQLTAKPKPEWRLLPYGTTQYFLVPNALIVYQLDHVEMWRVTPLDAGNVRVATSIFAPEAPPDERTHKRWIKNLDLLLKVTETEDFAAMEKIQANLASGALPEVIYGRIEPMLAHMHKSIDAMLASAGSQQ